jgi:hypothetical protein
MDAFEFNGATEDSVRYFVHFVLFVIFVLRVAFALLLMIVLFPIASVCYILINLPMWLRMIFIFLIVRRMMFARGP